jgi:hypothetical protein
MLKDTCMVEFPRVDVSSSQGQYSPSGFNLRGYYLFNDFGQA